MNNDRPAVLFMGSPPAAVPALRALADHPGCRVAGVVSQPERSAGRGRRVRPSAVQAAAEALHLPVITPTRIKAPEALQALADLQPQLVVVCAYGQILPQHLLDLPPLGCYNLHFSLLPRWRGASPVQAALLAGDGATGVSLQRMVMELDAGDIAAETPPMAIEPADTAATLEARLAAAAARLLTGALPALLRGHPPLQAQDALAITHCRLIRKADGAIDWEAESAQAIERKVRAYTPWPGCHGYLGTRRVGLGQMALPPAPPPGEPWEHAHPPGTLLEGGWIAAREGWLQLLRIKPEGKGEMDAAAFLNGARWAIGARLTPLPQPP